MTDAELTWMSGFDMAERVRSRDVSPIELVDAVLERLEKTEPALNAFVTVTADRARRGAVAAEAELAAGAQGLGRLHGVPISVKDLTDTAGVRTTYGSKAFAEHVPQTSSVPWQRLEAAGAILIGKTTTPEFGGLGVTQSDLTGVTNNPWNIAYTSGGSSGGAAASVAAGVGALAWGSDGGGSVRVPAACCGVVGLKPSRGRIPVGRAWESVGTDGPLTRTVLDSALLLSITAGHHPSDPLSLPDSSIEDYVGIVLEQRDLRGLRIAFVASPAGAEVDLQVARIVREAVELLDSVGGATVDEVALDIPDPVRYFLDYWTPEMAATEPGPAADGTLASENPLMLLMRSMGEKVSATDYVHTALTVRGEISREFQRILDSYDLIVTPTMPVTAFPHPGSAGGNTYVNGKPVEFPFVDFHRFTESPSHAGLPAITVPCGFSPAGLPVGMQIIGPHFADSAVLSAAAAFEVIRPWRDHRPAVT